MQRRARKKSTFTRWSRCDLRFMLRLSSLRDNWQWEWGGGEVGFGKLSGKAVGGGRWNGWCNIREDVPLYRPLGRRCQLDCNWIAHCWRSRCCHRSAVKVQWKFAVKRQLCNTLHFMALSKGFYFQGKMCNKLAIIKRRIHSSLAQLKNKLNI